MSVMQKLIEMWIWLNYPSVYNSKTDNQLNDNKIIPLWLKSLSKEPGTRFITEDKKQKTYDVIIARPPVFQPHTINLSLRFSKLSLACYISKRKLHSGES